MFDVAGCPFFRNYRILSTISVGGSAIVVIVHSRKNPEKQMAMKIQEVGNPNDPNNSAIGEVRIHWIISKLNSEYQSFLVPMIDHIICTDKLSNILPSIPIHDPMKICSCLKDLEQPKPFQFIIFEKCEMSLLICIYTQWNRLMKDGMMYRGIRHIMLGLLTLQKLFRFTHNDLHLGNVAINSKGEFRIIDLGLSRLTDSKGDILDNSIGLKRRESDEGEVNGFHSTRDMHKFGSSIGAALLGTQNVLPQLLHDVIGAMIYGGWKRKENIDCHKVFLDGMRDRLSEKFVAESDDMILYQNCAAYLSRTYYPDKILRSKAGDETIYGIPRIIRMLSSEDNDA